MNCGSCMYYVPNKDNHGAEGTCVRYPPTPFCFPGQTVIGAAPQIVIKSIYPPMRETNVCGEWHSVPLPPEGPNTN